MDRQLLNRRRSIEELRARYERAPGDAPIRAEVRDSWDRCAPDLPVQLRAAPIEEAEVDDRWDESPIRRASPDLTAQLQQVAVDGDFVAAITDHTGQILWSSGGRTMTRRAEQVHFTAGGRWDERSAGTNAPGLALITAEPATVFAVEHWCEAVHDWVCYAAPVRAPDGRPVGVIDLSTTWQRHSPLALATVTALARVVEAELRAMPAAGGDVLRIQLLGPPSVTFGGTPLLLPLRQLEILAIMAAAGPLTLDVLHAHLYGDRPVSVATLKAEMSHLRRALNGGIASRPYRLTIPYQCDFVDLDERVRAGQVHAAARLYRGQLLADSEAPFVIDRRYQLDAALRAALVRRGSPADLLAFAQVHPWDVEVIERASELVAADDALAPIVSGYLAAAAAARSLG